ncbi:hypothetical protein Tco_0247745 [Tanacetum coccineum]
MHNNIMAAGSKDRPPMLGPGRYSQWRSRFLRYLDTKSNVAAHEEAETIHNITTENKLYFQAEKEAIFLILTGIGDEIYSTVDACNTAKEIWTAIERLQQGESVLGIWEVYFSRWRIHGVLLLPQFQNEVNDIRSERLSRSANSLALLAVAQPYSDNYY